ncbi:MAG: hypothetical protein NDF54_10445 [archaeon GB-1867-035]|nr:hypothetical protein [Candidatus Culexmicrobium profundum]
MPTASYQIVDYKLPGTIDPFIVVYNGKIYSLLFKPEDYFIIANLTDKVVNTIDINDPNALSGESRIIDFKRITGSTVVLKVIHIRTGELVVDRIEVDLDAFTAVRTEEKTIALTWISGWGDISHSIVIPPRLWIAPDTENSYLHYVDIEDETDVSFDTGLGGFFARPSHKFIPKTDDIYMLLGVHLAGDTHKLLKVYSQTVSDLGFSTGDGSPRSQIGGLAWFYNDILIPATSGGVVDADNDIRILDINFSTKATINVGNITGWATNDMGGGLDFIAKKTDGGYYVLLAVNDNVSDSATKVRIYWLELDSVLSVVNSVLLSEIATETDTSFLLHSDYTGAPCSPIIDTYYKRIHIYGRVKQGGVMKGVFVDIDISDIWSNISEFNKNLWFVRPYRIPTQLLLNVRVL